MSLSRSKLSKRFKISLGELGYVEINDTLTGSNGLFIKEIEGGYFLSLGFIISRYYESRFTASYYLSKSTRWGSLWGDIPKGSYRRVSHFLNMAERKLLVPEEFNSEEIKDSWWDFNKEHDLNNFILTIKLTEERIIGQEGILQMIDESKEVQEFVKLKLIVEEKLKLPDLLSYPSEIIPKKLPDNIPLIYFKASELAIKEIDGILNENTIKLLAGDAWRQHLVKKNI